MTSTHAQADGRRQMLRAVGSNAAAKIISLPVSVVLGIVITRLLIDEYGQAAYVQYALLVSIAALIPFMDLGVGAAITNTTAASRNPRDDLHLQRVLVTCIRVLCCSTVVLVLIAASLGITGAWSAILGGGLDSESGSLAASLALCVFAVSLLPSFGQRILGGLGLLHWTILLRGLQTPIVLLVLLVSVHFRIGLGDYLAVVAYVALLIIAASSLWIAHKKTSPLIRNAVRDAVRVRRVRGEPVLDTAWPMLIQMIALPIAMQTDRLLLSHVSSVDELAEYSLAAQMFNPIVGVVSVAGFALWPIYAKARAGTASGTPPPAPGRMALLFACVALVMSLAVAVASNWLSEIATGGVVELTLPMVVSYVVFVTVQGWKYPLGMYLTDTAGLRFQALMILLMLPANLGISLLLAREFGAPGPIVGSVLTVAVFQVMANSLYVRRRVTRYERQSDEAEDGV